MTRRDGTPYNPHAPHPFHSRKGNRWDGYDYATSADYFVTVVVHDRLNLFGVVDGDHVNLSPAGEMIQNMFGKLLERYPNAELLSQVIMPNHIHLVIGKYEEHFSLPEMMAWFKGTTTFLYGVGVNEHAWPRYHDKLWQRSYHDHVIRNERALQYILRYIDENPARWTADNLNSDCQDPDEIMKTIRDIELGTPPPVRLVTP
jgi:putative transposase